ncbi:MAG: hypothetical protein PVJ84_13290 [Desulfobacteraceae bacterium]|jgi:hypothetical protein
MGNFVILIGGPGLFKGCDKTHDQSWTNYIVPLQLAAQRNLYRKQPSEVIHWVLYEPPYRKRWLDDSVITEEEKRQIDGYHLHSIRKAAADRILAKGALSYIDRIKMIANENHFKYKGINRPSAFWNYLQSLDDNSITRVWYSGHASRNGLMLSIIHNSTCQAAAYNRDMINTSDISTKSSLQNKFDNSTSQISKFYGCYTNSFAKEWNSIFGAGAAGAKEKIDFGVVDRPSNIVNIMERIEKTPTSVGNPDWTVHN